MVHDVTSKAYRREHCFAFHALHQILHWLKNCTSCADCRYSGGHGVSILSLPDDRTSCRAVEITPRVEIVSTVVIEQQYSGDH